MVKMNLIKFLISNLSPKKIQQEITAPFSAIEKNSLLHLLSHQYRLVLFLLSFSLAIIFIVAFVSFHKLMMRQSSTLASHWLQVNHRPIAEAIYLSDIEPVIFRVEELSSLSPKLFGLRLIDLKVLVRNPVAEISPEIRNNLVPEFMTYRLILDKVEMIYGAEKLGQITVALDIYPLYYIGGLALALLIFLISVAALRSSLRTTYSILNKKVVQPLERLAGIMKNQTLTELDKTRTSVDKNNPNEINQLYDEFAHLMSRICEYGEREREQIELNAQVRLAAQVVHDIRSPLAALRTVLQDSAPLSDVKKNIVRQAVLRVDEIASSLLSNYRDMRAKNPSQFKSSAAESSNKAKVYPMNKRNEQTHILSLILDIVQRKRLELLNPKHLQFVVKHENAFDAFTNIPGLDLERIVSNVINNSIEAITDEGEKTGRIELFLKSYGENLVTLTVTDNGKGIAPEVLQKLGQEEISEGKTEGTGLGLSYAGFVLRSFGGGLNIHSTLNQGTSVSLSMSKIPAPMWFLPKLDLHDKKIVVIDDDPFVHDLWKKRFTGHREFDSYFSTEDAEQNIPIKEKTEENIFLVDYQLGDDKRNGLKFIRDFNLANNSFLISHYAFDHSLLKEFERLGVRVLPKSLLEELPITF